MQSLSKKITYEMGEEPSDRLSFLVSVYSEMGALFHADKEEKYGIIGFNS